MRRHSVLFDVRYQQPQESSPLGGKNSSTGKHIFLKTSQGFSVLGEQHSLDGTQKSYTGMSICTLRMSCTIVKIPSDTSTTFSVSQSAKQPPKHSQMEEGMQDAQQSH